MHWMANYIAHDLPVPLAIFDPRWLYDGLNFFPGKWEMNGKCEHNQLIIPLERRHLGDRFADHGEQMIMDKAFQLIQALKELNIADQERLAHAAMKVINKLISHAKDKAIRAPARLPTPNVPQGLIHRRNGKRSRALTGHEIAVQNEKDNERTQRRDQRRREIQQQQDDAIAEALRAREDEQDAQVAEYYSPYTT